MEWRREVEVREEVDVLVVGGGPAGMAAGVTAARAGAKVVIIEGQNCLGGMGTAGMLPCFCPFEDATHFYAGGFGREIYDRVKAEGIGMDVTFWGNLMLLIRGEGLKRIYDEMATEAKVGTRMLTQAIDVETRDGEVKHVICAGKSGVFAYGAKVVIDCTGDGDIAAWAGADFEKGDETGEMMAGTLCSLWEGVDWEAAKAGGQNTEAELAKAMKREPKMFTQMDPHLPGIMPVGPNMGGGNVGHCFGLDGTDERSIARATTEQRRIIREYQAFYQKYMKGFEKAEMVLTAGMMGVRETRRIMGDYVLAGEDFEKEAVFEDEIGRYNYWVDIHAGKPGMKAFDEQHMKGRKNQPKAGVSYGIPYRILTAKGLKNVLVAGRCVSTDRAMQSSIRTMPGCFITGQAAGMAAAMAVKEGVDVRGVDVKKLQKGLKKMGGYLPNA